MQINDSAGIEPLVSRTKHFEAVTRALNLFVGRGRRYSNVDCERGAGVPARMMESYRQYPEHQDWRQIKPEEFASLICFLGADFHSTYLSQIGSGQGAYWLPEGDGDAAALNTDSAEFNYEYARATDPNSENGPDIGPNERKRLQLVASKMGPKVRAVAA
jgi:hypothetical protein